MPNSLIKDAYLLDAQPLYCDGYKAILSCVNQKTRTHTAHSFADIETIDFINSNCNLIIFDVLSFGAKGLELLITLRIRYPLLKILICSRDREPALIGRLLGLGAHGFVSKCSHIRDIRSAIEMIMMGKKQPAMTKGTLNISNHEAEGGSEDLNTHHKLTRKELMTLQLLMRGFFNKDIATSLGVKESTVKCHVSSIIRKMGVTNRTQAIAEYHRLQSASDLQRHIQFGTLKALNKIRALQNRPLHIRGDKPPYSLTTAV